MKSHHLINELNQRDTCPYCHNNLISNEWTSLFELEKHYKRTDCDNCGKNIIIRIRFDGSGHDCWDLNSKFCQHIGGVCSLGKEQLEEKVIN
jgi:hypothetical protein